MKYAIGESVRVINSAYSNIPLGSIGSVIDYREDYQNIKSYVVKFKFRRGPSEIWFFEENDLDISMYLPSGNRI